MTQRTTSRDLAAGDADATPGRCQPDTHLHLPQLLKGHEAGRRGEPVYACNQQCIGGFREAGWIPLGLLGSTEHRQLGGSLIRSLALAHSLPARTTHAPPSSPKGILEMAMWLLQGMGVKGGWVGWVGGWVCVLGGGGTGARGSAAQDGDEQRS